MIELGLAVAMLRRRDVLFEPWRRRTLARLPRDARALFELVPANAAGPLFLDPVSADFDDGLDTVLSTPRETVRSELRRTFEPTGRATAFTRGLYDGDADAWQILSLALGSAHKALVEQPWARVRESNRADAALRGQAIAEQGLQDALCDVLPGSRWESDTLLIPSELDRHVDLEGHGLTLLSSPFWSGSVLTGWYPDGSRMLVYPAVIALPLVGEAAPGDGVGALLGQTRAAVLAATVHPCTTSEIARDIGISPASASTHAKTLRAAGLVTTRRDGKSVQHSVTLLGRRLLRGY